MGVYLATVTNTADVNFSGRLDVQIPALQKTNDASDRSVEKTTYTVRYCSPFAGQTPARDAKGNGGFESTQKAYGFWAVPPDIGTQVLVMFANGNVNEGFWIGCVPDMQINHMVPGLASSEKSIEQAGGGPGGGDAPKRFGSMGISDLPVAEVNRKIAEGALQINTSYEEDNSASLRPVHTHIAETLFAQGLIKDKIRGVTSSSARRETPSQVFGISTPGPIDHKGQFAPVNTDAVNRHGAVGGKFAHSRLGGHSFVMDDGTPSVGGETPIENELVRFRTRKGAQVLLHDSENMVYIINSTGTAWVELSEDGKIDMYADESFSVHTIGDFNLRAERDINIEAARNINMKATGQNKNDEEEGGVNELMNSLVDTTTGRIHMDAKEDIEMIAELDIKAKAGVDIEMFATKDVALKSEENMIFESQDNMQLQSRKNFTLYVQNFAEIEIGHPAEEPPEDSTGVGTLQLRVKNNFNTFVGSDSNSYVGQDNILEVVRNNKVFAKVDHLVNTDGEIHFNTSGKVAEGVVGPNIVVANVVGDKGERVPSDVVVQLDTFENLITPDPVDPAETPGIKRQSIMKRVPTAEPYAEHENVRKVVNEAGEVEEDLSGIVATDRELTDERFGAADDGVGGGAGPMGGTGGPGAGTTVGQGGLGGATGVGGIGPVGSQGPLGAIKGAAGSVSSAVSSATSVLSVSPGGFISDAQKKDGGLLRREVKRAGGGQFSSSGSASAYNKFSRK